MRSKLFVAFSLLIVASMALSACQLGAPAAPGAGKSIDGLFGFGEGDVPTIDPSLSTDTSSVQIVEETTVGLTRQNNVTTASEVGMATSWDVVNNADGTQTVTFHLRKGVPWVHYNADSGKVEKVKDCNGKDRVVTAGDFAYGTVRTVDPATASDYAYVLGFALVGANDYNAGTTTDPSTVGVKAIDDQTLEMTFNQQAVYNLAIAGMWVAHAEPQWLIDGDACTTAAGDKWTEPANFQGYGPYTLKDWVHDSTITIIANPYWPGIDSVPVPKIGEVTFHMLADSAAMADYEAGNLDESPVPLPDMDRVKADPTLSKELHISPSMCTYWYGFNTKAPVVDDQRVRLALSEAVDRQSLIDNVTKGGQEPAQWFSRPGLAGAPTMQDHPDLGVKFDPTDAKAQLQSYLDEKGLTADQLDLTLMFNTSEGHQKIAEAIQQMWKDNLGVDVKVVNQEWGVYLKTVLDPANTPQIFRMGWCMDYPDANNFLKEDVGYGGAQNPVDGGGFNWKDDKYESLIDQAAKETDPTKRVDLYAQAEEILVKTDAVMIPLYWYTAIDVTKPYITRTYSVVGGQQHFEFWDVNK
jgi:oligopeptide transport system substrate-binding protein